MESLSAVLPITGIVLLISVFLIPMDLSSIVMFLVGAIMLILWSFTDTKVVMEEFTVRTTSSLSDAISKDLKKLGMTFVGSTIIYSFLQSRGVINGHSRIACVI